MVGDCRSVIPASGALKYLDHLERRPEVVRQVKIRDLREPLDGLKAEPVGAAEQRDLDIGFRRVEVVDELGGSQNRQGPFGECAAIREACRPRRAQHVAEIVR